MNTPIIYEATRKTLEIKAILAVPTVIAVVVEPEAGSVRDASGRLPHLLYSFGFGLNARAVLAEGPDYSRPIGYEFDACTFVAPYLGQLYITGGAGRSRITVFSRESQERCAPAWPLPPQPWTLTQSQAGGGTLNFVPPFGSQWLAFAGATASVTLTYGAVSETFAALSDTDELNIAGVTAISYSPAGPRGQAIVKGFL